MKNSGAKFNGTHLAWGFTSLGDEASEALAAPGVGKSFAVHQDAQSDRPAAYGTWWFPLL